MGLLLGQNGTPLYMDSQGKHSKLPRWGGPGARWGSSHGSGEDTDAEDASERVWEKLTHRWEKKKSTNSQSLSIILWKILNMDIILITYCKQYLTISSTFLKVYIFKLAESSFFGISSHWQTRPIALHWGTYGRWSISRVFECEIKLLIMQQICHHTPTCKW